MMINAGISIIGILFLLFVLCSAAVFLFLVAAAIACKRPGVAAGILGVGLMGALAVVLFVVPYFFVRRVERARNMSAQAAAREMAAVEQHLARQQVGIKQRAAEMQARIEHQIAKMDIHALMDKADAPRIPLAQTPPSPPAAPTAAPSAVAVIDTDGQATASAEVAESKAEADSTKEGVDSADESKAGEAAAEGAQEPAPDKNDDTARVEPEGEESAVAPENKPPERASSGNAEAVVVKRPSWVDHPPQRVGNTQREVVVAGEYETLEECYRVTDVYLMLATYDHLMRVVGLSSVTNSVRPNLTLHRNVITADGEVIVANGRVTDYRLARLVAMGIGIDYIQREIAREEYVATAQRSMGPMKTLYTLIEFTPAVDRDLQSRWEASRRGERFAVVGLGAASVLGLLGMVWGLLKVDTLTRGYYTKRLFLGVPAAIIAIGGFLLLLFV